MFAGITRVRNAEGIIKNTLDHVAQYVDNVYVYDDASKDNTVEICKAHPVVKEVVLNPTWDNTPKGRAGLEGKARQWIYRLAVKDGADWVYCFDADEYAEFTHVDLSAGGIDGYYFQLFDFYITEADVDSHYLERKFMGPEYRNIPMVFKTSANIRFTQRVPRGYSQGFMNFGGYVKHYGKAISIEDWERKCDYYANIRWKDRQPELQKRWEQRRGKAIHTMSDFGRPLITWEDRTDKSKIVKL